MPLLEARGHRVLAPDLPGHGDDRSPAATVTLQSYADRICEIAGAQAEPVIWLATVWVASPSRRLLRIARNTSGRWCMYARSCRATATQR